MEELLDDIIKQTDKYFRFLQREIYTSVLESILSFKVLGGTVKYDDDNFAVVDAIKPSLRVLGAEKKIQKSTINAVEKIIDFSAKVLSSYNTQNIDFKTDVKNDLLDHAKKKVEKELTTDSLYADTRQKILAQLGTVEGISLVDLRKTLQADLKIKDIPAKYFAKWTQDIFYQYERASKNKLRKKLGLRFAIYQGGEIDTTRPFCKARNGKVFSDEEIEAWGNLEFAGKNDNYNPMTDLGGHRCRHRLDWVSDELAYRKRPDLEKKYGPLK